MNLTVPAPTADASRRSVVNGATVIVDGEIKRAALGLGVPRLVEEVRESLHHVMVPNKWSDVHSEPQGPIGDRLLTCRVFISSPPKDAQTREGSISNMLIWKFSRLPRCRGLRLPGPRAFPGVGFGNGRYVTRRRRSAPRAACDRRTRVAPRPV